MGIILSGRAGDIIYGTRRDPSQRPYEPYTDEFLPFDPLEAEYARFALDCGMTAALRFSPSLAEEQVSEFQREIKTMSKKLSFFSSLKCSESHAN